MVDTGSILIHSSYMMRNTEATETRPAKEARTMITNVQFRATYTVPAVGQETFVTVADFRQAIESLEDTCRRDFHACANDGERANWVIIARRVAVSLRALSCKRAKVGDWDRRERALDASAALITQVIWTE